MRQPSIILLVPYFGKWPVWFDFFLLTCNKNPDIDWVFFTDCEIPEKHPVNVKFISISFADYSALVSVRLGIDFEPDSPYKICDIKPALGHIHEDVVRGYDFWGVTDIDLVYGDLRKYFTKERLRSKDLYATHSRRISGHFFLVRNNEKMRFAYKKIKNWRIKFSDKKHYALDEGAFSKLFVRHKNLPGFLSGFLALFNPWARKSEFIEAFSTTHGRVPWVDGSFDFPSQWVWREGVLTSDLTGDREFPYFHFIAWKQNAWVGRASFESVDLDIECFKVTEDGMSCGCR